ncbi:MAG: hypothetical protein AB2392_23140 [Neobacillus sp.]
MSFTLSVVGNKSKALFALSVGGNISTNYKNKLIFGACSYALPDLSLAAFFNPNPMHISIRIASGP